MSSLEWAWWRRGLFGSLDWLACASYIATICVWLLIKAGFTIDLQLMRI